MILEEHERVKFSAYCHRQADSAKAIAQQLEKVSAGKELAGYERQKASAYAIVARDLDSMELMTLGDNA